MTTWEAILSSKSGREIGRYQIEDVAAAWRPPIYARRLLWSTDLSYWTPATEYGLTAAVWMLRAWRMSQQ